MSTAKEVPGLPVPPDPEVALLLQTVWDIVSMGGQWPTYERVDRVLFHHHQRDIDNVMSRTSTDLLRGGRPEGGAPPRDDGQLTLTLAGAASCSGSGPAIDVVVAAARLAAAAERNLDPVEADPLLTFAEVAHELGVDPSDTRNVARQSGLLLVTEPWAIGNNSLSDASWQLRVDRRARPYADVHDLTEYWARRQQLAPASPHVREVASTDNVIQLKQRWWLGEKLGEGGFGQVFAAVGDDGNAVAVKFVPKEPGAERELLFAHQEGFRNVVPVLDDGEHGDAYVMVMPMADATLRERLFAAGGLSVGEALTVLIDVATALTDLEGHVVHRDIKPANVMMLDGIWCLADFGISRYSDASTATHTRMYSLSKEYAAPEQWRMDRATSAVDVYAVGVMAFELLAGQRPFPGPRLQDFREQHLHQTPPRLAGVSHQLDTIVQDCLAKPPEARPTPGSLLRRLQRAATAKAGPGLSELADAYRQHCEQEAATAVLTAQAIAPRSEQDRRPELAAAASRTWARVSTTLLSTILDTAPGVAVHHLGDAGWLVLLGGAAFELSTAWPVPNRGRRWPFDVIAHATVRVEVSPNRAGWAGRSHSLWYCDAQRKGEYSWFEAAFMSRHGGGSLKPFALQPEDAEGALSAVKTSTQVARPFTELVPGETDEFMDRWIGWFGAAVKGDLLRPSTLPEGNPLGSWRQA